MDRTTISSYVGVRMRAVRTTGARSDTDLASLGPGPLLSTQQGEGKKKKKRKEGERDTTQHAAI